jgi:hypothetical protein
VRPETAQRYLLVLLGLLCLAVPLEAHLNDTAERDDPVRARLSLPRRIYLDTSTLQDLYDFGGVDLRG